MLGLAYSYLIYETIFLIVGFREISLRFNNLFKTKHFFFEIFKIIILICVIKFSNLYFLFLIILLFIYDIKSTMKKIVLIFSYSYLFLSILPVYPITYLIKTPYFNCSEYFRNFTNSITSLKDGYTDCIEI